jgi:ribonucleoside-diphosphate reductase alpha chain
MWFMPATPILYNAGISGSGGLISCFLNSVDDNLKSIVGVFTENIWLASKGGGIGTSWSKVRSLGEKVSINGKSSGIIPFLKIQDSLVSGISQGNLRRGSAAAYLDISHPDVEEFIETRRPTGGDLNRRTLNLHHGIIITDAFMEAVIFDGIWEFKSPVDGQVRGQVKARDLWIRLLTARIEMGEPYLLFIDRVNENLPDVYRALGNKVATSNLCSEITLSTGTDHLKKERTAVCCLSSLNLEYYDEWKENPQMIEDVMRFLDNVLEDFINSAPDSMFKAKYSAMRERSVGLGVMGFHSFLQSKNVPMESAMAKQSAPVIRKRASRVQASLRQRLCPKEFLW